MAKCSKCNQPATKNGLCKNHQPEVVAQKQKVIDAQKAKMAKDLADKQDEIKAAAAKVLKDRDIAAAKEKKVKEIAVTWNAQVQAVVSQVLKLRRDNPTVHGINAGNNAVGNTLGGTNNPVKFVVPANDFKITNAEVYAKMNGFEGSDSGSFKFRVSEVFVHGH